jgi:hypothetical protein
MAVGLGDEVEVEVEWFGWPLRDIHHKIDKM